MCVCGVSVFDVRLMGLMCYVGLKYVLGVFVFDVLVVQFFSPSSLLLII